MTDTKKKKSDEMNPIVQGGILGAVAATALIAGTFGAIALYKARDSKEGREALDAGVASAAAYAGSVVWEAFVVEAAKLVLARHSAKK